MNDSGRYRWWSSTVFEGLHAAENRLKLNTANSSDTPAVAVTHRTLAASVSARQLPPTKATYFDRRSITFPASAATQ